MQKKKNPLHGIDLAVFTRINKIFQDEQYFLKSK